MHLITITALIKHINSRDRTQKRYIPNAKPGAIKDKISANKRYNVGT